MKLTCPECKNEVDLTTYSKLEKDQVVECNHCGITLGVTDISDSGEVASEIVDEGK